MAQVLERWYPVVAVTVLGLPSALLVAWAMAAAGQRRGVPAGTAWRHGLAATLAVYGTLPWVFMALSPGTGGTRLALWPLRDLARQLTGDLGFAVGQIGGNLLFFAALGFWAPLRWARSAGLARLFALGAAGSLLIEFTQYALRLGRVSSVDDVLLNALGAVLGGLASRRWWERPSGDQPTGRSEGDTPIGDAEGRSSPVP